MTARVHLRANAGTDLDAAAPTWVTDQVSLPERMLMLTYRVAVSLGCSRRERARLCRRVLSAPVGVRMFACSAPRGTARGSDPGRRPRAEVLTLLRVELGPRVERTRLDEALRDAVLLDEIALLPPRQRFALWASALAGQPMARIVIRTGWTPSQVARLLRAALRTVTVQSRA
ncbi:MAG: hypothetical protein ABW215_02660 [Kibdelosporangium sp.]